MHTIYIRKMSYEKAKKTLIMEIERAFYHGHQIVEVIHGIGEYKLHDMVIEEIQKIDYVELYEGGLNNNPGATKISILSPDKETMKQYIET